MLNDAFPTPNELIDSMSAVSLLSRFQLKIVVIILTLVLEDLPVPRSIHAEVNERGMRGERESEREREKRACRCRNKPLTHDEIEFTKKKRFARATFRGGRGRVGGN